MPGNNTVIEVAGKKYEMKPQEDGTLIAIPITDETLFEVEVLEEGFANALKTDINRVTREAYDELCNSFKRDIKGVILKQLGFDRNYDDQWRIDHCNGRMSVVTEHLSHKVKEMFKTEVDAIIEEIMPQIKKEARTAVYTELKEAYQREARECARNLARTEAKEFVTELLKSKMEKLKPMAHEQVTTAFTGFAPRKKP